MKILMILKATVLTAGFISSISTCYGDFGLISDASWDNSAVRRVLHTFAYGGFASDAQIQAWADMPPQAAIAQILTFAPTNDLLSPPEMDNIQSHLQVGGKDRTLQAVHELWMNGTNPDNRYGTLNAAAVATFNPLYSSGMLNNDSLKFAWMAAVNKRGLNPFRQRVGLWLTNYLMSVHAEATHSFVPIRTMYDESMDLLAQNNNFATVLGDAAASAAIAVQYKHRYSKYYKNTGQFYVNDDFAREFHQLFFGINGVLDGYAESSPEAIAFKLYYENVTIEGTAEALTGMEVLDGTHYNSVCCYAGDQINFQSPNNVLYHFGGAVEALNFKNKGVANVSGATAEAKLANLAQIAINDPESERNLPVKIASYFADDNLGDATKTTLRSGWLASGKNLLSFLRAYAISPEFHSASRFKYMNAFERNMRIYTQNTIDNIESYVNFEPPLGRIQLQDAELFYPKHFVFGGQTGIEASDNSQVLKEAYNANVTYPDFLGRNKLTSPSWVKDWAKVVPKDINGNYIVGDVARWLWNHFVGDGGKNYGPQEKAYISALLATGVDFLTQISPTSPDLKGYTDVQLQTDPILSAKVAANENTIMNLNSTTATQREAANLWVGMAVNFITVTPFMFAQEGL